MPDINVNKLSEALNTKADTDLNNTGVFSTSGGGGKTLLLPHLLMQAVKK